MPIVLILTLLGTLLVGIDPVQYLPPPPAPRSSLTFTRETFPRIDGSTSTRPLRKLVACRALGVACSWQSRWTMDGQERDMYPDLVQAAYEGEEGVDETTPGALDAAFVAELPNTKTHGAYVALIEGETDLLVIARAPSEDERVLARERGVELELTPVALDALAVLANARSPLVGLTSAQLRGIYAGEVERWSQLGVRLGPEEARRVYADLYGESTLDAGWVASRIETADEIHAYTRERNSGSQELMEALVMGGEPTIPGRELMVVGMGGTFNELDDDLSGIGYTVWYYQQHILPNDEVKLVAIDGVAPTVETLADRSYPFIAEVYLAWRSDEPATSDARRLADFLLTPEGQALVAESGFVPVGPAS